MKNRSISDLTIEPVQKFLEKKFDQFFSVHCVNLVCTHRHRNPIKKSLLDQNSTIVLLDSSTQLNTAVLNMDLEEKNANFLLIVKEKFRIKRKKLVLILNPLEFNLTIKHVR